MSILASNLKLLRKESYLGLEEIALKVGSSSEELIKWEEGLGEPSEEVLEELCRVLHMPYEDIRDRDLAKERMEALEEMKKGKTRTNYDWYFGSRSEKFFHLGYIIYFIIGLTLTLLIWKWILSGYESFDEYQLLYPGYSLERIELIISLQKLWNCLIFFFIGAGIFMAVWYFKRHTFTFNWRFIFFYSLIIIAFIAASVIFSIPFFVYSIIKLFFKKRKAV